MVRLRKNNISSKPIGHALCYAVGAKKSLIYINREKIDAIREAIRALERAGYIVHSGERNEKGRLRGADYVIFVQPQTLPVSDLPTLENPTQ